MAQFNPIGKRRSWYAEWRGERLPCVHKANMQLDGTYRASKVTDAPHELLLEAIRTSGRVIVRQSVAKPEGGWEAKGYVGLFEVADAEIVDDEFRFRFIKRIE